MLSTEQAGDIFDRIRKLSTADEVEVAKRVIAKDKKTGVENIQWALLNSTEFLVNH